MSSDCDVLKFPMAKRPLGLYLAAIEPAHSLNSRWKKVSLLTVEPSACGIGTIPLAKPPPAFFKRFVAVKF